MPLQLKSLFLLLPLIASVSCATHTLKQDMYLLEKNNQILENKIKNLESKIDRYEEHDRQIITLTIDLKESSALTQSKLSEVESLLAHMNNRVDSLGQENKSVPIGTSRITTVKSEPQPATKTSSGSEGSWRCQAITKKGTQCKRAAQSGRRFCWQH